MINRCEQHEGLGPHDHRMRVIGTRYVFLACSMLLCFGSHTGGIEPERQWTPISSTDKQPVRCSLGRKANKSGIDEQLGVV